MAPRNLPPAPGLVMRRVCPAPVAAVLRARCRGICGPTVECAHDEAMRRGRAGNGPSERASFSQNAPLRGVFIAWVSSADGGGAKSCRSAALPRRQAGEPHPAARASPRALRRRCWSWSVQRAQGGHPAGQGPGALDAALNLSAHSAPRDEYVLQRPPPCRARASGPTECSKQKGHDEPPTVGLESAHQGWP